jgi:DHA1 family inner membrane transport protein
MHAVCLCASPGRERWEVGGLAIATFGIGVTEFVIVGLRLFIGNLLGEKLADRALMLLLYVTLAGQSLVLFAFFFVVESRVASALCVFLMAGFGFASVSPI